MKNVPNYDDDSTILRYFNDLKGMYRDQRQQFEPKWEAALDAYLVKDGESKVYNGRSNLKIPIMHWKVNGIVARIMRIMFNSEPFARIEKSENDAIQETFIDIWNDYIFEYQLKNINFKSNYRLFTLNKTIYGTAVAKVSQETETKEFTFFDDEPATEITVKDDTFFRPILLTEFYSDINFPNINDSQCCIHSTVVSIEQLRKNEKRTEIIETEVTDETGNVIGIRQDEKITGVYENLDLLDFSGIKGQLTIEQIDYTQKLGISQTSSTIFQKSLEKTAKTGFVHIDECYGLYDLDGDGYQEECLVTIANSTIVIRKQPTPFRHKKYVRPFIVGRFKELANQLYGISNIMLGQQLYSELNASRAQATDSKTASVFPMFYQDTSRQVMWDGKWRPNGIIKGNGPNGLTPIINPNLGNISINDSVLIQRDIDQLWSLSPVQEGTSDNRFIPQTARGTQAIISQNDMPLNEIIDTSTENEIKPFLEMVFERNLVFKSIDDLLKVVSQERIKEIVGAMGDINMKDLVFNPIIKIFGSVELSNEIAMQSGWVSFGNAAAQNPNLSNRVNWKVYGEKLLRSFGIKDDSDGIFIDEKTYQEAQAAEREAQAAQLEEQMQMSIQMKSKEMADEMMMHQAKSTVDTQAKIVEMAAKERIEGGKNEKGPNV